MTQEDIFDEQFKHLAFQLESGEISASEYQTQWEILRDDVEEWRAHGLDYDEQ